MKKLLVAAMGIAAAYGAFADPFSVGKRFEGLTTDDTVTTNELNEAAGGGTYWTDPVSATNTYTVKAMGSYTGSVPAIFENDDPANALEVKTTFGSPLAFNFMGDGGTTKKEIGDDGLYFDSLVKFTVCDGEPEDKEAYNNAKIMMWLQSNDDNGPTNIMIRAGYLTYSAGQVGSVETNYTCYTVDEDFADSWHRVTIKAIKDITSTDPAVPGFVVFIDGEMVNVAGDYDVWGDGFPARTAKASHWETNKALFPSMVQSGDKTYLSAIEFDGTGSLNDVAVTETAPAFAVEPAAPEVAVTINGTPHLGVLTFADAVTAVNGGEYGAAGTATITLSKDAVITEPVEFTANATITLDFAGFVLTNTVADAAITNSAAALIITNSSNTVGGIYCSGDNDALALVGGTTTIDAGVIGGKINPITSLGINGGYFAQDDMVLHNYLNNNRKKLSNDVGMTSLFGKNIYGLVDITYYTVTYNANGGDLQDDDSVEVEEGSTVTKPENPTRTGYTFTGWYYNDGTGLVPFRFDDDESEAGPVEVESDLTLTAQWDALPTYTITFVYGLTGEYSVQQIGIQAGETPELPAKPETPYAITGYNIAWPTFAPASASVTYTATYTGKTFTIYTCTNGVVNTSKEFTYAGASVAPADPTFNSETEEWDGKWYISNGSSTEFAFNPAGELTQYAYATITAKSGGGVPDIPAGGETDCGTAEAAAAAADAINKDAASKAAHIKVPTGAVAETYLGYVEAVAVGTKVKVDFSEAGAAVAQTSANNDVVSEAVSAAVAAAAAAGSEGSGTASVSTVAGFYYSIVSGTSPTAVTTEGTRVLGTGGSVNLTVPNKGPAGFYKVKVSARSAD